MTLTQTLPILAALAFGAYALVLSVGAPPKLRNAWVGPAVLSAVLLGFSLVTVAREGLIQFWINHTSDLTGNQVWFDLLLAIGLGLAILVPRARAAGMAPLPWVLLTAATGCIGLFAMAARVLYLEQASGARTASGA